MNPIQLKKGSIRHVLVWIALSALTLTQSNPAHAGFGFLGRSFSRYTGSGTEPRQSRTWMGALRGAPLDPRKDPKRIADQQRIEFERAEAQRAADTARELRIQGEATKVGAMQPPHAVIIGDSLMRVQEHRTIAEGAESEVRKRTEELQAAGKSKAEISADPKVLHAQEQAQKHRKNQKWHEGIAEYHGKAALTEEKEAEAKRYRAAFLKAYRQAQPHQIKGSQDRTPLLPGGGASSDSYP